MQYYPQWVEEFPCFIDISWAMWLPLSHGIFTDEEHMLGMLINEESLYLQTVFQNKNLKRDFPGSPVVKTSSLHCRRHGFDPWSGNKNPTCHKAREKKKERERETWRKNLSPARSRGPSWLTQPSPGSISQTTGYPRTYETEINAYSYKLLGFWDGWWYSQNWQVVHLGFYPSTYNYGYKCYCISLEVFIDYQPST